MTKNSVGACHAVDAPVLPPCSLVEQPGHFSSPFACTWPLCGCPAGSCHAGYMYKCSLERGAFLRGADFSLRTSRSEMTAKAAVLLDPQLHRPQFDSGRTLFQPFLIPYCVFVMHACFDKRANLTHAFATTFIYSAHHAPTVKIHGEVQFCRGRWHSLLGTRHDNRLAMMATHAQ